MFIWGSAQPTTASRVGLKHAHTSYERSPVGILWDMYQQNKINENIGRTDSLDDRVRELELRVSMQERVIRSLIDQLERRFGEDLSGDGEIGLPGTGE